MDRVVTTQLILYRMAMWLNFEFGQDLCQGHRIAFIKGDKRKSCFSKGQHSLCE